MEGGRFTYRRIVKILSRVSKLGRGWTCAIGLAVSSILLLASGPKTKSLPCASAESTRAEDKAGALRSWAEVYRWYRTYNRCNNALAGEAYSEAIARLLVDHWESLPSLDRIAAANQGFLHFVLGGINTTLDMKDVGRIRTLAIQQCPTNSHHLCSEIKVASDTAISNYSKLQGR
jgi:hypothetical protein